MSKFTKGPWRRENEEIVGDRHICTLANWRIVGAGSGYDDIEAELRAEKDDNASLIAAAPELYEALERILRWADPYALPGVENDEDTKFAEAIIKKIKKEGL